MVKSQIIYQGTKRCELTHEPSGNKITTDAPKDNFGKGEAFSPTDLVGAALGSCIITTMAIVAERDGVDFLSAKATVEKVMRNNPRSIESLNVHLTLPASWPVDYRKKMERVALTCPVHKSLHPDVQMPIVFEYI